MKYTYIGRIKNTLATASIAFVALLAFSTITNNQIASADSLFDYDGWGGLDSYDYSDYSAPSSYDYGGWGGLDSYDYSYPSYDYGYSSPSYGSSYTPSYGGSSYVPSPSYSYVPTGSGGGAGTQLQYVSSSNTNNNANANTNTISNTFNPTNNNDAKINLIVYGGGGSANNTQSLDGSCTINPSTANINQNVTFNASATGGNGSYSYSWTGDNGVSSSAQNFTGQYSYSGYKTATVTITSNGQSITRTCGVNIQNTSVNTNAYCVANPTNAGVGQGVTWTAYPSSTNGSYYGYTYTWTGSDNMYGNGQSVTTTYGTPGYKTATVTMYGNGQTLTATCNTNVGGGTQSNVTVIRDQNLGTPVSGVFLSQVPETGISLGLKMTLFGTGLILWSIFAAYMIARRKNGAVELASANGSSIDKIAAFKLANMQKKGIQA